MVREYDLDALRLDTAPYMPMGFLAELQVVIPLPSSGVTPPSQCLHPSVPVPAPLRPSTSSPPFQCLYPSPPPAPARARALATSALMSLCFHTNLLSEASRGGPPDESSRSV